MKDGLYSVGKTKHCNFIKSNRWTGWETTGQGDCHWTKWQGRVHKSPHVLIRKKGKELKAPVEYLT